MQSAQDFVGDEVFARGVGGDDGTDQRLRHVLVVGQQLLGVLGQAIAAVAEAGVVVVAADARVQAHAFNDLASVQAVDGRVGVELVEEGHAHGEVGVGKQLDGLGLGAVGEQHGYIFLLGPFQQQVGKGLGAVGALADDDAAGVQVVVQGLAFAQEFGAEDEMYGYAAGFALQRFLHLVGEAHGHGGLDDHGCGGLDGQHAADDGLDAVGVEVVGDRVVVGGGGDDDEVGAAEGVLRVERGAQLEGFVAQKALDVDVFDG